MEQRKIEERNFHNLIRDDDGRLDAQRSNLKFYSIVRSSRAFMDDWLRSRCGGKLVLDYGCGNGAYTRWLAQRGARAVGIDISDVSASNGRKAAIAEGWADSAQYCVMDCEALAFKDSSFDLVFISGVLHHLALEKAFTELARVLKPGGEVIAGEGLADNPLIRLYRKRTPHLRTAWEAEHIMRVRDLELARRYFAKVSVRFFHLFTIGAVPFRNTRIFNAVLRACEAIDSVILKVPLVRKQAWQMVFTLSEPNKTSLQEKSSSHTPLEIGTPARSEQA